MLDRRAFLQRTGVAAAALSLPGALAACSASTQPDASGGSPPGPDGTAPPGTLLRPESILDTPASQSSVDHIVVLMMENRSFDHWLGWMAADAAYLEAGRRRYGGDFHIDGNQQQTFSGPAGPVTTAHMLERFAGGDPYRGCGHPDPGHSWNAGRAQRDAGFVATGSGNDEFALGYYLGDDVPFTSRLAKRFTTFDRSFASVLGPTYPNREYLLSGQSGGIKNNQFPPTADGFAWETILDRLMKAGVTTRCYYTDLPVAGLWGPRMVPLLHKIEDYFTDCAAGQLPSVSFVDPGFTTGHRTDNHPHGDIRAGERFVKDVVAAFARSPNWHKGALVLTYDEWGGFFDHVAPPVLPDDRSGPDAENFGQAGFRVPTVLMSPFAQPGFVDHRQYDHTSILRFLEWRFLGAPAEGAGGDASWSLTTRDRNANNIAASLVSTPTTEIDFDLDVGIEAPSPECAPAAKPASFAAEGPPAPDPSAEPDKHSFELLMETGYFEAIGVDAGASSMTTDWV